MNAFVTVAYHVHVTHAATPYKGVHAFDVMATAGIANALLYHATSPRFGIGPTMPTREAAIVALVRAHGGLVESIEGLSAPSFV